MYDLRGTTFNCVVLGCFTNISIPESDLLQSSTHLNSQRSIERMLPLNTQSITGTHSDHSGSYFIDEWTSRQHCRPRSLEPMTLRLWVLCSNWLRHHNSTGFTCYSLPWCFQLLFQTLQHSWLLNIPFLNMPKTDSTLENLLINVYRYYLFYLYKLLWCQQYIIINVHQKRKCVAYNAKNWGRFLCECLI